MSIEQLKNKLPEYARDIKLNLSSILVEEGAPDLNQKQIYLISLTSAYTTKNAIIIEAIHVETKSQLTEIEINAAKAAAVIMAMNNIYYRFTHLVSDKSYSAIPAKLRMNVLANHGINKIDFEMSCLAASAINGCGMCIDAHAHELTKLGVSKLAIQSTVRIASVLNAAATSFAIAK